VRCRRPRPAGARRRGFLARWLGTKGERAAGRELRRRGYSILGRNLATPRGEVDLLAEEGGDLVLVEVKTTAGRGGLPGDLRVDRRKRARLLRAGAWLARTEAFRGRFFRLDLVAVTYDGRRRTVTIRRDVLGGRQGAWNGSASS
jgi:putative endonuclease